MHLNPVEINSYACILVLAKIELTFLLVAGMVCDLDLGWE